MMDLGLSDIDSFLALGTAEFAEAAQLFQLESVPSAVPAFSGKSIPEFSGQTKQQPESNHKDAKIR
jgi:hypothetical protein